MEDSPAANNATPAPTRRRTHDTGRVAVATLSGPFGLFGVSLLLGVIILSLGIEVAGLEGESGRLVTVVSSGVVYGLALTLIWVLFSKYLFGNKPSLRRELGLFGRVRRQDIGLTLLAFGAYFLTTIFVIAVLSFIPGFDVDQAQDIGQLQPETIAAFVIAFIGLVVFPPIFEELIFRGFMFSALRRQLSFWPSTLLVSIAFGLVHGQPNVAADTFVLSIFLCALRERTNSIWAPILLHAIKNGLAFTLLFVLGAA